MPADTRKYPRATRVLTKKALTAAWFESRDSTSNAGSKGVDGVTARQFKTNIHDNISRICSTAKSGTYHFSKLRPFLVPKKNGKYRVICVPTVSDRLVQRTIARHIGRNDRLGLLNRVSYGFVSGEGKGVQGAIVEALRLRARHEWVLKTDIQSFFDEIRRLELKERIKRTLGVHSLVPLLCAVVDLELRPESKEQSIELMAMGLRPGRGLRQGMPLSPLLSNFVLATFDEACIKAKKRVLRYADDLILFGDSKGEIEDEFQFLSEQLAKVGHTLPAPGVGSKTELIAPKMGVEFLGLELIHKETEKRYVCRIPKKSKSKILTDIADKSNLKNSLEKKMTFESACRRLAGLPRAYRSAFRQAEDWSSFEPEVTSACNKALRQLFIDIFGSQAISNLKQEHKTFLGISSIPDE